MELKGFGSGVGFLKCLNARWWGARAGAFRAWVWVGVAQRPGEQGPFPSHEPGGPYTFRKCCSLRPHCQGDVMTVEKARDREARPVRTGRGGGAAPGTLALTASL